MVDDVLSIHVMSREICVGSRNVIRRIPAIAVDAEFGHTGAAVVSDIGPTVFKLSCPFVMFPEKTIGVTTLGIDPTLLPASIE